MGFQQYGGVEPVDPVVPWPGPLIDATATVPAWQLLIRGEPPAPPAKVPVAVIGNPVLSGTPVNLPPGIAY